MSTKNFVSYGDAETLFTDVGNKLSSLNSNLTSLEDWTDADAKTVTGNPITITDAANLNANGLTMSVEPIQDLHGQSAPYVGGAGKNKLPLVLADIKSSNTDGTWSGNTYTYQNVTLKILTDVDGNVNGLKIDGTNSGSWFNFILHRGDMSNVFTAGNTYTITDAIATDGRTQQYENTFTVADTWYLQDITIIVRIQNTSSFDNTIIHPQLEDGSTATIFAPYTNICPISGRTSADILDEGKNLFDNTFPSIGETLIYMPLKVEDDTYIMETTCPKNNQNAANLFFLTGNVSTGASTPSNGVWEGNSVTVASTDGYITIAYRNFAGANPANYITTIRRKHTATITFGETVYGGSVDFNTGKVRVTHKCVDLGDYTWSYNGNNQFYTSGINDFAKDPIVGVNEFAKYCICEKYKVEKSTQSDAYLALYYNTSYSGYRCFVFNDPNTEAMEYGSEFKTYITGTHICYELATPTELTLTPAELELLKGNNTITANGATISLTYQPDNLVGEVMEQVQPQIDDLQEQIDELSESVVDRFDDVIGWSDRRNLFDAKHVAIEELPNATGTLQYGCKFDVVAGKKYTVSSNMTETLFLFSKTGTDAAVNIFTLTSSKSFSFTAETNTIYYLRNASSTTVDTFRNKLLNGEVQFEEGSVATSYQTFHPIIGDAVNGLIDRVPTAPTTDGTYNLQVTVASGTPTYSWVSTT